MAPCILIYITVLITQVVANTAVPTVKDPAARGYEQHFHPPLVRTVRNLEDELKDLPNANWPNSNNGEKLQSFTEPFNNRNTPEAPKDTPIDPVMISATDRSYDTLPSNPAATEYMLTSRPTPQLPNINIEDNSQLSSFDSYNVNKVLDQSLIMDHNYDGEDEDDDDSTDNDNRATNEKRGNESQFPTTPAPAFNRDTYFFAKEDLSNSKNPTAHAQLAVPVANENLAEDVVDSEFSLDQQVSHERSSENVEGQRLNVGQKELVATAPENAPDSKPLGNQNQNDPIQVYNSEDDDASLEIDITDETPDERNQRVQHDEPMQRVVKTAVDHSIRAHNEVFASNNDSVTDDIEVEEEEEDEENNRSSERTIGNDTVTANLISSHAEEENLDDDQNTDSKEGMDRFQTSELSRKLVKKSTKHSAKNQIKSKQSENEEILQMLVKVAEDPKDWEEIRELLEKIQYNESTLRKAKSRLRALAKKQRIKSRKSPKGHTNEKISNGHLKNKGLPKFQKQMTKSNFIMNSAMQERYKGTNNFQKTMKEPQDLIIATSHHDASPTKPRQSGSPSSAISKNKNAYIKVSVFPAELHHHERQPSKSLKGDDDDYAIETPVTVIGERSRVDPVEKQLLEASANQRLREIQQEKARLAAIAEPTDEMEKQLKALTKLEHRLMEHRRRKQKLLQKMNAKELHPSEKHSNW